MDLHQILRYGKAETVACIFQPWLLGLAIISLISSSSLFSKTFRIWRIFKSAFDQKIITNIELFIHWLILLIPAIIILILWMIIATPSAQLRNHQSYDHLVCSSAGLTGPPLGIIFFFIFVAYAALLLLFGAFLSFVTRNVPSLFNESKLIALSIYNLVFLSVVVIPVVIVLNNINPFAWWIIRSVAIFYAFFATLIVQFLPKFVPMFVVDRCSDDDPFHHSTKSLASLDKSNSSKNTFTDIPEAPDHDDDPDPHHSHHHHSSPFSISSSD